MALTDHEFWTFVNKIVEEEAEERAMKRSSNTVGSSFHRGAAYGLRQAIRLLHGDDEAERVVRAVVKAELRATDGICQVDSEGAERDQIDRL